MFALKKALHAFVIAITKIVAKLLPDRVPMTFIGTNSASELCTSLAQTAKTKVLIVTDAGLVKAGITKRVTDALDSAGVGWSVYDGVEPDPTFTQVEAGLRQLAREKCDAVLAVGGGSSMDAAKIIAASATNGNDARKLEGMMKVRPHPCRSRRFRPPRGRAPRSRSPLSSRIAKRTPRSSSSTRSCCRR
jgi:alcohol dehydrogenase